MLPLELIDKIFNFDGRAFCAFRIHAPISLTCKYFKEIIDNSIVGFLNQKQNYAQAYFGFHEKCKYLEPFVSHKGNSLTHLSIKWISSEIGCNIIKHCPNLVYLCFKNMVINSLPIPLQRLTNMAFDYDFDCMSNDRLIDYSNKCPNVKKADILFEVPDRSVFDGVLANNFFKAIENFKNLRSINFDIHFGYDADFNESEKKTYWRNWLSTDAAPLINIHHLGIDAEFFADVEMLHVLKKFPCLQKLSINSRSVFTTFNEQMIDRAMFSIKTLNLVRLTDEGAARILNLFPNLESLEVSSDLSSNTLRSLSEFKCIRTLQFTTEDISHGRMNLINSVFKNAVKVDILPIKNSYPHPHPRRRFCCTVIIQK